MPHCHNFNLVHLWQRRCCCVSRYVDRGLDGRVWRQLQRGSADDAAVRLVLLAGRVRGRHVPRQRHLHGVPVERRATQGHAVRDRTHPQAPGRVGRLTRPLAAPTLRQLMTMNAVTYLKLQEDDAKLIAFGNGCSAVMEQCKSAAMPGPDLRGRGPGPRLPSNSAPPTKPFVFYFSLMIDAYETTT